MPRGDPQISKNSISLEWIKIFQFCLKIGHGWRLLQLWLGVWFGGWVDGLVGEWMVWWVSGWVGSAGADPVFPIGGGANPLGGGASSYKFARFSEKLHEIKKILVHRGACAWVRHWSGQIIQNQINLDFFSGHFYLNHFSPLHGYFWVTHPDQQAEVNSLSYTLK